MCNVRHEISANVAYSSRNDLAPTARFKLAHCRQVGANQCLDRRSSKSQHALESPESKVFLIKIIEIGSADFILWNGILPSPSAAAVPLLSSEP